VHDTRRDTREAAGTGLDRPVTKPQRERPLEHVEHVMKLAVTVRRRTGKPRRQGAFGKEERTAGVLPGGLDDNLRRPGVMVLAFAGPVENRVHV
jgi:hypothetical protein